MRKQNRYGTDLARTDELHWQRTIIVRGASVRVDSLKEDVC